MKRESFSEVRYTLSRQEVRAAILDYANQRPSEPDGLSAVVGQDSIVEIQEDKSAIVVTRFLEKPRSAAADAPSRPMPGTDAQRESR